MIPSSSPEESISQIVNQMINKKPYIIAIAGAPGAGKSTISSLISKQLPNSKIISMDGYHLYRSELNQQGMKRRGAGFTFNKQKFKKDIIDLKQKRQGKFPSFDHKLKDPIQNDIKVTLDDKYVIMQGLYLFYQDWGLNDYWDMKIWIECDAKDAIDRVSRHFQSGIEPSIELSIQRANNNDKVNLQEILIKSNLQKTHIIKNSNNNKQPLQ